MNLGAGEGERGGEEWNGREGNGMEWEEEAEGDALSTVRARSVHGRNKVGAGAGAAAGGRARRGKRSSSGQEQLVPGQ